MRHTKRQGEHRFPEAAAPGRISASRATGEPSARAAAGPGSKENHWHESAASRSAPRDAPPTDSLRRRQAPPRRERPSTPTSGGSQQGQNDHSSGGRGQGQFTEDQGDGHGIILWSTSWSDCWRGSPRTISPRNARPPRLQRARATFFRWRCAGKRRGTASCGRLETPPDALQACL